MRRIRYLARNCTFEHPHNTRIGSTSVHGARNARVNIGYNMHKGGELSSRKCANWYVDKHRYNELLPDRLWHSVAHGIAIPTAHSPCRETLDSIQ
jgi:hypothetical protein